MTGDQERGGSLTRREESLERPPEDAATDLAVPDRAGAIVSEFVASVVEEANSRAQQIMAGADEGVAERRAAALDAVVRVSGRIEALAAKLTELRDAVAEEAKVLTAEVEKHGIATPVSPAGPVERSQEEEEALATVAGSLRGESRRGRRRRRRGRGQAEPQVETFGHAVRIEDAEVVPDEELDEAPGDDLRDRLAALTDEELAREYAAALEGSQAALAGAAVEEALGRPAFQDSAQEPRRGLRGRLSRRARRSAVAIGELRQACRAQRERRPQLASGA